VRTDITQNSRVTVAVARSRRKKQSLRGMRRRGTKQFTTLRLSESKDRLRALPSKSKVKPRRGLMQNSQFTINGFSSKVRFHRCHSEAEPKNLLISSIYSSCARPGRLRGSHLRCEPAPGARSKTLKHSLYIVRKLRGRLEYATGGNAERWKEKMFGAAAACRDRIRLQPCEPKPRHAETRKTRSAGFGTKISPTLLSKPNSAAARATLRVTP
jgi:hypothetical protein